MIPDILKFNRPLQLPPQLQWKFANDPELLSWTIKARNYDLFWANTMFIFMSMTTFIPAYIMYSIYDDLSQPWRFVPSLIIIAISLSATMLGSHRRVSFAYRLTKSGIEYCKWKNDLEWALPALKLLTLLVFLIFLLLATLDISLLLGAVIGPDGMIITYLSLAHNKNIQRMNTEYHHKVFAWNDFEALIISTNRDVVDLTYSKPEAGSNYTHRWNEHIFCKPKQKEHIAEFLRHHLPSGLPVTRAKADIW